MDQKDQKSLQDLATSLYRQASDSILKVPGVRSVSVVIDWESDEVDGAPTGGIMIREGCEDADTIVRAVSKLSALQQVLLKTLLKKADAEADAGPTTEESDLESGR